MPNLQEVLRTQGYKKINFKVSKTQHLLIKASINGVFGNFILDTGASYSCVGFESIALFTYMRELLPQEQQEQELRVCTPKSLRTIPCRLGDGKLPIFIWLFLIWRMLM